MREKDERDGKHESEGDGNRRGRRGEAKRGGACEEDVVSAAAFAERMGGGPGDLGRRGQVSTTCHQEGVLSVAKNGEIE